MAESWRHVTQALPHDSAAKHVQGRADYIDDLPEPQGTLHAALILSPAARGHLLDCGLDEVKRAPGVVRVLTAIDIPGRNDIAPALQDEPLLADERAMYFGQPIALVLATSRDAARRAARLARPVVEKETPSITIEDALARGETVLPDYGFGRGDVEAALHAAPHRLQGQLRMGGQEHFYLEGQIALAIPGEDGEMLIHSSTQHPTEVQHCVARILDVPHAFVTCETRRMGGAFGGKESQAVQWAALAALGAYATGHPCKLRLDRDDDMQITGKRHDMRADWQVGFDAQGQIKALTVLFNARCGCSADLSQGVVDRTMFHADNAYYLPSVRLNSKRLKTNTVSNTAFRGFGGPQGMLAMERVIDAIAWHLQKDPLDIRKANLYRAGHDETPYGMRVDDYTLIHEIMGSLEQSADYRARREAIKAYNASSPILKKGLALTPVKFGISFTLKSLNQAGALVNIYGDGSVRLNHGGTEMGQGLYQKIAQMVADELGIDLANVRITPTTTAKVPNTSPTAASSGTDLNGMAALRACRELKQRLAAHAAEIWACAQDDIVFSDNEVCGANHKLSFAELAASAIAARIPLSATGFYATPDLTWDRAKGQGRPFFYFAYGAACSEIILDTLTGENRATRIDILHDVGRSINPALDRGQIEGGFVQGMGWLTTEELVFDQDGRLRTHAPSTYKIPVASDVPADFRVALYPNLNRQDTVYRSKAVGEPPLMLAISVFAALCDALHSLAPGQSVPLDAPATPEAILRAARALAPQGAF